MPRSRTAPQSRIITDIVQFDRDGGLLGVTGAAANAFRLFVTESALEENFHADAVGIVDIDRGALNVDGHADAEYREHLISVILRTTR
jgi:aerobic carbon-monoxide dehydrogenase medium subunit